MLDEVLPEAEEHAEKGFPRPYWQLTRSAKAMKRKHLRIVRKSSGNEHGYEKIVKDLEAAMRSAGAGGAGWDGAPAAAAG